VLTLPISQVLLVLFQLNLFLQQLKSPLSGDGNAAIRSRPACHQTVFGREHQMDSQACRATQIEPISLDPTEAGDAMDCVGDLIEKGGRSTLVSRHQNADYQKDATANRHTRSDYPVPMSLEPNRIRP
jgi:hypothetical protein